MNEDEISRSNPSTDAARAVPRRLCRRRALAAAGSVLGALAGCLEAGPGGGSEEQGEVPVIEDMATFEVTMTDDGVAPQRARVPAGGTITVQIKNDSSEDHTVGADSSGFPQLAVPSGTIDNEAWEIADEPGRIEIACVTHEEQLVTVDIEPMGVSSGCPTG